MPSLFYIVFLVYQECHCSVIITYTDLFYMHIFLLQLEQRVNNIGNELEDMQTRHAAVVFQKDKVYAQSNKLLYLRIYRCNTFKYSCPQFQPYVFLSVYMDAQV